MGKGSKRRIEKADQVRFNWDKINWGSPHPITIIWHCSNCGILVDKDAKRCDNCGVIFKEKK